MVNWRIDNRLFVLNNREWYCLHSSFPLCIVHMMMLHILPPWCYFSIVISLIFRSLGEILVAVLRKWAILKSVVRVVVCRQRINLHLADFSAHEVLECSCLLAALALIPIFDLREAHARWLFFCLHALQHSLMESEARMGQHAHWMEGFHVVILLLWFVKK